MLKDGRNSCAAAHSPFILCFSLQFRAVLATILGGDGYLAYVYELSAFIVITYIFNMYIMLLYRVVWTNSVLGFNNWMASVPMP